MRSHQQRVVDEKAELDTKLAALRKFNMFNPVFQSLDAVEKNRLVRQENAMHVYSMVLGERIEAFK